jgi:hypothetical protein
MKVVSVTGEKRKIYKVAVTGEIFVSKKKNFQR